ATTDTQPVSLVADLLPDVTLTGVRSDPAWVELTVPLPAELGPDRPTLSAVVKVPAATVAGEYEVEITSHVRGLDESVRGTLEITVVQGPSLRFPQADDNGGLWDCGHTIPDVELSLALRAVNKGDEAVRILRADTTLVTETSSNQGGITIAIVSASALRIEAGAEAQIDLVLRTSRGLDEGYYLFEVRFTIADCTAPVCVNGRIYTKRRRTIGYREAHLEEVVAFVQ